MKTISYKQIVSFDPCFDPKEIGIPEDYEDTVVNLIQKYLVSVRYSDDIIFILLRKKFMNERDLRLFAVWCAQQVKHLMKDQRSLDALIVAEKFAFGEVELKILCEAAPATRAAFSRASRAAAYVSAIEANCASALSTDTRTSRAAAYAARYASATACSTDSVFAADATHPTVYCTFSTMEAFYAYNASRKAQIYKLIEVFQKPNGEWFERTKE